MPRRRRNLVFESRRGNQRLPTVVAQNFSEAVATSMKKGAIMAARHNRVDLRIIETDSSRVGYSKAYADAWDAFQKRMAGKKRRKRRGKGNK